MSSGTYAETAPSALTEDQTSFARTVGLTGLMAVALGVLVLVLNAAKAKLPLDLGNNVGFGGIVVGLAMMFYHATRDTDQLIRRLYGFVGGLGLPLAGVILSLLPLAISAAKAAPEGATEKPLISLFFPFGWACFLAGLFFLIPFCRNETDESQRRYGLLGLGGIGAGLALLGMVGGLFARDFALVYGSVLGLLGLAYLVTFINQMGGADGEGYQPALIVGALGAAVFLAALGRSVFPGEQTFFVPHGLVLMALGVAYMLTALFLVSDWRLVVLTRRELMAYFCSPIAYILVFMSAGVAWWNYNHLTFVLAMRPMMEPIVLNFYLGTLYGVLMLIVLVPALTMRLFSEEKRTGTFEVLMLAPVSETPVVVSKLLAALTFYMLTWAVWLVFLLDIRVEAGKAFEYRTLITFHLILAATGAAFLSMGIFFSSLTRNQIVAAVLTFFGMIVWLVPWFVLQDAPADSTKATVMTHLSFVWLWIESLQGRLHLRDVIIQLSLTVFWCFLTVRVLEARRWG